MAEHDAPASPSEWVTRWAERIAPDAQVLDLACGSGRHTRYLAARGLRVCAVDRDAAGLAALRDLPGVEPMLYDLETPWPFPDRRFGGIVVTNYLYRPLLPALVDAVAEGGVLIFETFAVGNETYGRPSNPAFLLRPGELLEAVAGRLRVLAYEDLYVERPKAALVQRICAQRGS